MRSDLCMRNSSDCWIEKNEGGPEGRLRVCMHTSRILADCGEQHPVNAAVGRDVSVHAVAVEP